VAYNCVVGRGKKIIAFLPFVFTHFRVTLKIHLRELIHVRFFYGNDRFQMGEEQLSEKESKRDHGPKKERCT